MWSHVFFLVSVLCMFILTSAKRDGINAISPKQTGINAVDRQTRFFRVLGGTVAPPPTVRALANIIIIATRPGLPNRFNMCTGTVLSRRWLLTAAHCFFFEDEFQASIQDSYTFIGQSDATLRIENTDMKPHRFARYLIHKNFLEPQRTLGNDLALIFLDRPVPRNNFLNVRLSRRSTDPQPVAEVQVAGYGLIDNGRFFADPEAMADRAMQASVTLQNFTECNRRFQAARPEVPIAFEEKELVCSFPRPNASGENADICSGDSGGPIFRVIDSRIEQFGITSFSSVGDCAGPESVSYYTRVSNFRRDIRQGRKMNFTSWDVVNALNGTID